MSITTPSGYDTREIANRLIRRLEQTLSDAGKEIDKLKTTPEDVCIIKQREEQIRELKQELSDITRDLVSLGLSDKDELMVKQKDLEGSLFKNSLKLKRMLKDFETKPTPDHSIRLPKIAVPTFNGDILTWKPFWEQFSVAVHSRTDISNQEKLVYLRHSVKDGSARSTIEGLSRTGDNYDEAIECLKTCYDKPRQLHQAHVRKILDISPLKSGSGKELRHLHDTALQHLRALKSMGFDPSGPFITSMLELKLDPHPLFSCGKFKALPQERMMSIVKSNELCLNCLRPGHFVNHCKSAHKCHECQKSHHTLLHLNSRPEDKPQSTPTTPYNHATVVRPSSLLMTCQILVTSPTGLSVKARALLDAGSSISFITDRLAKSLHLRRRPQSVTISGVAGITDSGSSHAVTSFQVSPLHQPNKQCNVSAIAVPQVTCKLPTYPTPTDVNWNHLQGLVLADPNFGEPSNVDVLLGVDIFVATLLDSRRFRLQGAPSALETEFGWVLAGGSNSSREPQLVSHHATLVTGDNLLRRFWEIEEATPELPILSPEETMVMKHFADTHSRSPQNYPLCY